MKDNLKMHTERTLYIARKIDLLEPTLRNVMVT